MRYFSNEKINDHIWRIMDPIGVAMYLVEGESKACLIDTGYGFQGLKAYVSALTDKPVFVLLTHGHVDHAFGIYEFDDVYMNELDLPLYLAHSDLSYRLKFMRMLRPNTDESELQEERQINLIDVPDGKEFDLGGYTLKAYHVPGHTKGSLMVLFKEDRIMLFGDAAGPGTLLIEEYSSSISSYVTALKRIKAIEAQYDRIIRNHGTFESGKQLLDNVIRVGEQILAGTDDKIELPAQMYSMFPDGNVKRYKMYQAKKTSQTPEGPIREDGLEGNISYRHDKVC